jgi:hypothetical protein
MMRPIRFEPYFIEEAVFLRIKQIEALGQKESAHSFHQGRTRIYETVEKEGQPKAFQDLNATFFSDLCLDKNFQDIFQEYPLLQSSGMDVYVKSTFQKRQERSELFVDGSARTLILSLRVLQTLDLGLLAPFLRHELMHISDMVDPDFQYDPNPVMGGTGQVEEELIRDRFRVLWNLYVSARLVGRGHAPLIPFNNLRGEFERSFSHIDEVEKAKIIQNFVGQKKWTQAELLQLARNERINKPLGEGGLRCPLCHFTSYEDKRVWTAEHQPIVVEIQRDFPKWNPTEGLCSQCFDLYSSRVEMAV